MAGCPSGIPADAHFCYGFPAHCAAVEVESASLALGSKEDAMLIGFALIIVAVFLCCALLFRLSIYALPLFVAFLAGSATYRTDSGILAALAAAAISAIILLAAAQLTLAFAKSDLTRAAVGFAFAAPAAIAGYHAVHGIAAATMPPSAWQHALSLLGAAIIAAASWTQWSRARH
jgi:phosphoglycerol transferase MdoB-like AlkP superfamily enzyme